MLKLPMRRKPLSDHSYSAEKSFEATLRVERFCESDDQPRWLGLSFATNPNGKTTSLYDLAISPKQFADLAKMMIEADPVAAIQAFGAAMQTAEIRRCSSTERDSEAA